MTNRKKDGAQLGFPTLDDIVDLDRHISAAFARDLKHPTKSRRGIADELSSILGRTITEANLNNLASVAHQRHRLHLDVAAAIYKVTGNMNALKAALEPFGILPITGKDITYLELAKALRKRQRLDREIEELEGRLR